MIQIVCNRCGSKIESIDKVGYIRFCFQNPVESHVEDESIFSRNHYCESCMAEIEQFVRLDSKRTEVFREKDFVPKQSEHMRQYEQIISLKQQGMRNKDIAEKLGISAQGVATTIYTHKKKQKDDLPQESVKKIDFGKISALWKAGWDASKIADEMDMEEREIVDILNQGR